MKQTTSILAAYLLLLLAALLIAGTGCKKNGDDSEPTPVADLSNESDFMLAELTMNDANGETDVILKDTLFYKSAADTCRYIDSIIGVGFQDTIIKVRYNECMNTLGRTRKGLLVIRVEGAKYNSINTKVTISFKDFYINQYRLEGKRVLIHKGVDMNSKPYFSVYDSCIVTDTSTQDYMSWQTVRTHTWFAGFYTQPTWDDVYIINSTGSYLSYRNSQLKSLGVVIKDLRREVSCQWPVSGTVESTPAGLATRTIDFGNGGSACDNIANVYINGKWVKTLELK